MAASQNRSLMPRDERRAQILRAAAVAFAGTGYAATSMDEVAKCAGITKLIIYRHFDSKAHLYREILEDVAGLLVDHWTEVTESGVARVAAVEVLLPVARRQPDGFRLLFVHASREAEFESYHAEFRQLMLDLATERVAPLVPDPIVCRWLSRQLVDFHVNAVLNWVDIGPVERDEEFTERVTNVVLTMVRAAL